MRNGSTPSGSGFSTEQLEVIEEAFSVPPPPDPVTDPHMGIKGSQGRLMSLLHPDPELFQPEDVARGLAHENRYAGNYGPYSVAQHSVLVARVVEAKGGFPPQVLAAIHHDDAEVITGDIPTPIKRVLRLETDAFDRFVARLDRAIEQRYQVNLSDPLVQWADKVVFNWEVRRLVPEDARWIYGLDQQRVDDGEIILPYTWFVPWSPNEAFARYMDVHENATRAIEGHTPPQEFNDNAS